MVSYASPPCGARLQTQIGGDAYAILVVLQNGERVNTFEILTLLFQFGMLIAFVVSDKNRKK